MVNRNKRAETFMIDKKMYLPSTIRLYWRRTSSCPKVQTYNPSSVDETDLISNIVFFGAIGSPFFVHEAVAKHGILIPNVTLSPCFTCTAWSVPTTKT